MCPIGPPALSPALRPGLCAPEPCPPGFTRRCLAPVPVTRRGWSRPSRRPGFGSSRPGVSSGVRGPASLALRSRPAPRRCSAPGGARAAPSGAQGQPAPAPGPLRPPCSRASRASVGTPGAEDTSRPGSGAQQPDAAACVRSAGASPNVAKPGRVGRSFSPAFPFPVPRPTLPRLARALFLPGMAY
ncbi:unnamed protein product [Rangifer tarandus platyrhynchus]|uniref:Uncharacterized protein n=1 Tax=Rangifer tarandus platyrhynchus TaxID=3082113 RepID=A0AC59ZVK9_RANTA